MIHLGAKAYALRGIARMTVGPRVVWNAANPVGALSVSASPTLVRGAQAFGSPTPVATDSATAAPSGGTEPYTYAWSEVVSDGGTWQILSPTKDATAFRHTSVFPGDFRTATFKCLVTDARGRTGEAQVDAFVQNYGDQSAPTIAP